MEKSTNRKIIITDIPSSRDMDMSPATMAKKVGWSLHTVRKRVHDLDLTSEQTFSLQNDGDYEMYNHECLPILTAYIGKKPETSDQYSEEQFLQKVAQELDRNPKQKFCRYYLYNQKEFLNYYLREKMEIPLHQRVDCIKDLSKMLDTVPNTEFQNNAMIRTLAQLDRFIYELANYISRSEENIDKTSSDCHGKSPANRLTSKWCSDLISRRNSIANNGIITCKESARTVLGGLEQRLLETLSPEETYIAKKVKGTVRWINQRQNFSYPTDIDGESNLREDVYNLLLVNMNQYLRAVFSMNPVPEFDVPKSSRLSPFVLELAHEAFGTIRFTTERMEKYLFGLNVWFMLNKAYFDQYEVKRGAAFSVEATKETDKLLKEMRRQIRVFWQGMQQAGFVPSGKLRKAILEDAVETAEIYASGWYFENGCGFVLYNFAILT